MWLWLYYLELQSYSIKFKRSLEVNFNNIISYQRPKSFLKDELGYSSKLRTSRFHLWKNSKLVYMQMEFAARILSWINNSKVIVSVDESSYAWSIKVNNSYYSKKRSYPIINSYYKGRLNLIFTIKMEGHMIIL